MSDERGSARLAEAVVRGVVALHPTVTVELTPERDQQPFTMVEFTPQNPRGAKVILYANHDWSFGLEGGRFVLFEDAEFSGSEDDHVDRIVAEVDSIARRGVTRSVLDRALSFGTDRCQPWSE